MDRFTPIVIAAIWIIWAMALGDTGQIKTLWTCLIAGIVLLWFGELIAHYRGRAKYNFLRGRTPSNLVKTLGWVLLVLLPLILLALHPKLR